MGTHPSFPTWVCVLHWFNFLFLSLLVRSGLEILSAHPKLYWSVHCKTGSEWTRFTHKRFTDDRMFASTDEEEHWSPWMALPGRGQLGLGRYWHFIAGTGWILCGVLYLVLMCTTGRWRALIPTSWSLFPEAAQTALMYLKLQTPPEGHPYNALQQITYFGVIFVLTPLQIYTGIAMSPAVSNRFIWPDRVLGGRQAVRSLHFIGVVAFCGFFVGHLTMVIWHGLAHELAKMAGSPWMAAAIVGSVVLIHVVATRASLRQPSRVHWVLSRLWDPLRTLLLHGLPARPTRHERDITPLHHMNGYPPIDAHPSAHGLDHSWEKLAMNMFHDYRLEVRGNVEQELDLSLDDLHAMPYHSSVQTHMCIQGWTGVGKWGGVHLADVLALCKPRPSARYVAVISFQRHEKEFEWRGNDVPYYECIDLALAHQDETLLAFDMNDRPLTARHGAPLRLRLGSTLGFKMVKYIRRIEIINDLQEIGEGRGGCREDLLYFDVGAEI